MYKPTFGHGKIRTFYKGICWKNRTVCYLCDTIKKYNTIYVITNTYIYIYYIYTVHTPPKISTLWMVISGCNPLCIWGFPDCQVGMWSTSIGLSLQMLMIFTYGIKFSHIEEAGWWKEAPLSNSKKKAMEIKNWFDSRVFWLRMVFTAARSRFFGLLMLSLLEHGTLTISFFSSPPGSFDSFSRGYLADLAIWVFA